MYNLNQIKVDNTTYTVKESFGDTYFEKTRGSVASGNSSTATDTKTAITNYDFTPGIWLVSIRQSCATAAAGSRAIYLSTSSSGASIYDNCIKQCQLPAANAGWITTTFTLNISAATKIYFITEVKDCTTSINISNTIVRGVKVRE